MSPNVGKRNQEVSLRFTPKFAPPFQFYSLIYASLSTCQTQKPPGALRKLSQTSIAVCTALFFLNKTKQKTLYESEKLPHTKFLLEQSYLFTLFYSQGPQFGFFPGANLRIRAVSPPNLFDNSQAQWNNCPAFRQRKGRGTRGAPQLDAHGCPLGR